MLFRSELIKVANYVKNLAKYENIMSANERNFCLQKIIMSSIENFIRYYETKELSESQETDFDEEGDSIQDHSSTSSFVSPIGANEIMMQNQDRVPETIPEIAEGTTPDHDGRDVPSFTWFNRTIQQQRNSNNLFNN